MLKQPISQVRLTNVAVMRLKKQGKRFEIACYKNKILNWRGGSETNISEVLQTDTIFVNVSKGQVAKVNDLQKVFGTKDALAIARVILDTGELQVSEKEREITMEQTFRDVCTIVADRVFNRQTGLPLSISMIESTLTSLGFSISIDAVPKRQSLKAIELLCKELPNQIARTQMSIRVTFRNSQMNEVREFLTSKIYAYITSEQPMTDQAKDATTNELESSEKAIPPKSEILETPVDMYSITFYCDPTYYRNIDQFIIHAIDPPGTVQILSTKECLLNPNEQFVVPITEEEKTTDQPPAVIEVVQQLGESVPCRTCEKQYESVTAYRSHCRSKWHQFNVKRRFKNMAPIAEEEYLELAQDITHGFLAVDY